MTSETAAAPAPWIAAQARQLLEQRGHAWLLHGPSGLGQRALALELARGWLCELPTAAGACGTCPSCHAFDVHTHADLAVLMPETVLLTAGWPLGEKAQQEVDDQKRKASREIRVEAMRDAIEFAQRTSARGRGKVILIYPAERMNHVTANALLKTLEEPPGNLRFVLATEAAHQLSPTIRSRCMAHTMHWPAQDDALAWLAGLPCRESENTPVYGTQMIVVENVDETKHPTRPEMAERMQQHGNAYGLVRKEVISFVIPGRGIAARSHLTGLRL